MKIVKLIVFVSVVLFITSCNNNKQQEQKTVVTDPSLLRGQYIEQIKKLETEMHSTVEMNNVTAGLAIKAYSDYAGSFPNDSLTPDYLFKAGEIATATQQYPQALNYYKTITEKYPKFKYSKESLFLQAFLLDNYLNDDAKAKVIYEEVITKYPTSPYARDAKAAINNLGKTDEELIKEFKRKNKQK
jgi:outer membrane protein assembly factor BamD (BamD/ComL family)